MFLAATKGPCPPLSTGQRSALTPTRAASSSSRTFSPQLGANRGRRSAAQALAAMPSKAGDDKALVAGEEGGAGGGGVSLGKGAWDCDTSRGGCGCLDGWALWRAWAGLHGGLRGTLEA